MNLGVTVQYRVSIRNYHVLYYCKEKVMRQNFISRQSHSVRRHSVLRIHY